MGKIPTEQVPWASLVVIGVFILEIRVLDFAMRVRLCKTFHFEAAHELPTFPEGHKCRRLHGHSFKFDVIVEGDVDPAKGYLIDYGDIKTAAEPVVKLLDHYYLNKIDGLFNPTSENISRWLFSKIKPALPQLSAIIVYETC